MSKLVLYNPPPRVSQDCSGWSQHTVPNQSLSLREIIKRFVRREPLPMSKEGTYFEGDYDLEKLGSSDITEKHEVLEDLKKDTERKKRKVEDLNRPPASPDPNPLSSPPPA